jgi:hypothetical protein
MLSATFFRSRFDKMLYMLKMLKSGLPEKKEYLDTILSETIVSNITESDRVWTINTNKISLNISQKEMYDKIYEKNYNKGSEKLYIELSKFIHEKINYCDLFYTQLEDLEKRNRKVLIFTKSKEEADQIVNSPKNKSRIGRYPDKKQHTVVSYSEGTYGLNDLIIYDTILMRPPEPDKLPQIKGRLDRPGQNSKNLEISYILLKNTIEEASLLRMEMCNNFYNNYLMPLGEFYELAIKIHDINNSSNNTSTSISASTSTSTSTNNDTNNNKNTIKNNKIKKSKKKYIIVQKINRT